MPRPVVYFVTYARAGVPQQDGPYDSFVEASAHAQMVMRARGDVRDISIVSTNELQQSYGPVRAMTPAAAAARLAKAARRDANRCPVCNGVLDDRGPDICPTGGNCKAKPPGGMPELDLE